MSRKKWAKVQAIKMHKNLQKKVNIYEGLDVKGIKTAPQQNLNNNPNPSNPFAKNGQNPGQAFGNTQP